MKLLCDVHISYKVVEFLNAHVDKAIHVNSILDKWYTTDQVSCVHADDHDFIVVSKDKDFKNSHFVSSSPKKIILIALGNVSNDHLINAFKKATNFIEEANKKPYFF